MVQIRPCQPSDLPQIYDIFAYYIQTTVSNFYYDCPPIGKIESSFEAAKARQLPYLVAVEEGAHEGSKDSKQQRRQQQQEDVAPVEERGVLSPPKSLSTTTTTTTAHSTVLGYTYALQFRDPKLAYARSVEISVFVHPGYLHRGIGSLMMNELLDQLEIATHHATEPGHEVEGRDFPVRNVFAVMAHDVNDTEGPGSQAGRKLQAWYESFGFEMVARLKNVGWKYDRWVDTVYLQLDLDVRRAKGR